MPKQEDTINKPILNLIKLLKKVLKNKELLEDILTKLQPAFDEKTNIIILNDFYISFECQNGDYYSLQIDGEGIESYQSIKSDNAFQKKTITFSNDLIFASVEESRSEVDEYTSLPSLVERTTEKKVYRNNEVIYERKYHSKASASLNAYTSTTSSEETYVSESRIAYRRNIEISNEENNIPKITYSKCYSYCPPPFNNLENTVERSVPFFIPSNENEYNVYSLKLTNQQPQKK